MAGESSETVIDVKTILAFGAIYILWGSTFLAIRILVETVPVFLAAGARFTVAGLLLLLWVWGRGGPLLNGREWKNVSILGGLLFLLPYAGLFWAEKTLPSGVASVLVATIPLWTVLLETLVFRAQPAKRAQLFAIAFGFIGVIIVARGSDESGGRLAVLPCLALMGSTVSWSLGSVLSKKLILPASKMMSSGAQMLTGGGFLLLFALANAEIWPVPHASSSAILALIYLITAGSVAGFTAYMWLLGHMSATKVASYAYVNPVVALLLGHQFAGEAVSWQTLVGSAVILASVVMLLGYQRRKSAPMSASVSADVNGSLHK